MRDQAKHYQRGAHVKTFDGREVGAIGRIVFDAKMQKVTHLVVRKGLLLSTDRVIPVDQLDTSGDVIELNEDVDPSALPEFEQSDYVLDPQSDFYVANPGIAVGAMGPIGAPSSDLRRHRDRNVPEDSIALHANSQVIASDGEKVGRITEIVADPADDRAVQLVVGSGIGDRTKRVLPASLVISISEDEVHLGIDSSEVEQFVVAD
jgi:sporulation protein YlmC with PRC-barrel domain